MTDKSTVNRAALLKAVSLVRPALAGQAYLPALTHVRFAGGWATAYNDVSAIMVRGELDGDRCVPGDMLARALGSFSGDTVLVQGGKDGVRLSSGRANVKLPTLAASDFPFALPEGKAPEIAIDAGVLKAVSRCLFSAGRDSTHPAQMGVTLDADDGGRAVLFSTDNYTMSRASTKAKVELPGDAPVIMPTFFCEQMVGLAAAFPECSAFLLLHDGALLLEFVGRDDSVEARLFTRMLGELQPLDFPDKMGKHVDPSRLDELSAIPDAFEAALGRAVLVLGGEANKATQVRCGDGVVRLSSTSAFGDAEDGLTFDVGEAAPSEPFYVDPSLLLRAGKHCTRMAFLPKVAVMADDAGEFVHLVAYTAK